MADDLRTQAQLIDNLRSTIEEQAKEIVRISGLRHMTWHYHEKCFDYHDLVIDFNGVKPPIVCLCGSTRFVEEFNRQAKELTEAGYIVLSIEVVTTQAREDDPQHNDPDLKARLDELHKRKIDLADEVLVLNVGGYVGQSTMSEIEYAQKNRKPIRFLEPDYCVHGEVYKEMSTSHWQMFHKTDHP